MMSKSPNMLRTRRRDINIKPNRRDTRLSRLDRKSSRGMIYENEELRLRTININAEIERGQYDIKKLKRENEMLKKEIWCLRDEYEKLDKLLKEKEIEFSSSSTTCTSDGSCTSDTESCSSCSSDDECELEGDEQSQNLENVQKTTNMQQQQQQQHHQQHHHHHHYQHHEFDHLSVVVEENENSDKNSHTTTISPPPPPLLSPTTTTTNNNNDNTIIKPDQSYPIYEKSNTLPITSIPTYQNSIINRKFSKSHDTIYPNQLYHDINDNNDNNIDNNWMNFNQIVTKNNEIINKTTTDLIVKTDNRNFNNNFNDNNIDNNGNNNNTTSRSTFSNGGNLEELLNDIETISKDILQITNQQKNIDNNDNNFDNNIDNNEQQQQQKPYKSELNVVLMPNPMPLLGFEKYEDLKKSLDNLQETEITENPFDFSDYFQQRYNPENFENQQQQQDKGSKTNLLELSTSDHCISSENDENCKIKTTNDKKQQQQQQPKLSIRRKVSIHFKGKKDKQLKTPTPTLEKKPSIFSLLTPSIDNKQQQQQQQQIKTPSIESRKSTTDNEPKTPTSSDSRLGSDIKKQLKQRKSISISPERSIVTTTNQTKQQQQQHHDKKHKRHKKIDKNRQLNKRRDTISSIDNFNNIKLNRERSYSVCTDRSNIFPNNNNNNNNNNYRERTNSLSSCDTIQNRKMSAISNLQINGKVPWCACWGNGCI